MSNNKETFEDIISGKTPVLVDFYADWCMPCRMLGPIMKDLAADMRDSLRILKINVDTNQSIAQKYSIFSVPTVLLFENGELKWKGSGARPKEEFKRIIMSNTSLAQPAA